MDAESNKKPCKRGNIAPRDKSGKCKCDACTEFRKTRAREQYRAEYADLEKRAAILEKVNLYRSAPSIKLARAAHERNRRIDSPELGVSQAAYQRKRFEENPKLQILAKAKQRAKESGVPFAISLDDINIPDRCPALGIPLVRGKGKTHAGSPSLDRIIPSLGYVQGNVAVISHRANIIKQNATAEELRAVALWVERVTSQSIPENK